MAKADINQLLEAVVREQASDLHIAIGKRPTLRVSGALVELQQYDVITPDSAGEICRALIPKDRIPGFATKKEIDFSYQYANKARFRVSVFVVGGNYGAALRLIPVTIRTVEELNLPPTLKSFTNRKQGFFLVVGPTGHGKSTTLAALIDLINHERAEHIVTIEDPIEYLFTQDRSIITQREVGLDTDDFHAGLRGMFRQDVNVAMLGEMRDAETIATAVTAAETGHLVFSTLHTNDASQTVDRILNSFPANEQSQIRAQLANSLLGIFSQRLIPKVSGGLVPAYELLIASSAVRNLIREGKIHEIPMVIDTSMQEGMVSLNRSLVELVKKGDISLESAITYSLSPDELQLLLR